MIFPFFSGFCPIAWGVKIPPKTPAGGSAAFPQGSVLERPLSFAEPRFCKTMACRSRRFRSLVQRHFSLLEPAIDYNGPVWTKKPGRVDRPIRPSLRKSGPESGINLQDSVQSLHKEENDILSGQAKSHRPPASPQERIPLSFRGSVFFRRLSRFMTDPGRLDRWLLRPFAWVLCALVPKKTLPFFSGTDPFPDRPKRICLVKFSGLGSLVNTLPLLQAMRRTYPEATILYLSWESNRELASRVREIDRFVGVDTHSLPSFFSTLFSAIRALHLFSPDFSIDLQVYKTTAFTTLMTRASGARRTFSFIRPGQGFRKGLLQHTVPFDDALLLPDSFARLGIEAGVRRPPLPHPPLPVTEQDLRELARQGVRKKAGSRILVINPNASSFCLERRWPLLFFSETAATLLSRDPDLTIFLTGSAQEKKHVDRLEQSINRGPRVRNMAGLLSLGGLMALLDRCDVFLTNDSGPMHLGFLAGTPTVALFGPAMPDNHSIHARPDRTLLLYKKLPCSPCVHQSDEPPCRGHNLCMQQILPSEVISACSSLLHRRPDADRDLSPHSASRFRPETGALIPCPDLPDAISFRREGRESHGKGQAP